MPYFPFRRTMAALLAFQLTGAGVVLGQTARTTSLEELRKKRTELVQRPRRIIMNNDGCDALYFPKNEKVTVDGFLAKRTTPLADTQIDTIAYCSIRSGFSNFTHRPRPGCG